MDEKTKASKGEDLKKWLKELLASTPALGHVFFVAAIAHSGVIYSDFTKIREDAVALAQSVASDGDYKMVEIYDSTRMELVEQLDLTDRTITTSAPAADIAA